MRTQKLQKILDALAEFFEKPADEWAILVSDQSVYVMTFDDKVVTPESLERFIDKIGATPHFFDGQRYLTVVEAKPNNLVLFAFYIDGTEIHTGKSGIVLNLEEELGFLRGGRLPNTGAIGAG